MSVSHCPFCHPAALENLLLETEHFLVLGDHAPLVDGHILIIPREHLPCYGALPAALDAEFLELKQRVSAFLMQHYRAPVFFEHGVFHQTVFHAHLHAFPFGPIHLDVPTLAAGDGQPVDGLADIRAWYAPHGPYFYLEQPPLASMAAAAAVFPPSELVYRRVLGHLRERSGTLGAWQPPALRRVTAGPKLRELRDSWQTSTAASAQDTSG